MAAARLRRAAGGIVLALAVVGGSAAAALARTAVGPPPPIEHGPSDRRAVAFACNVVWGTPYVAPILDAFRAAGGRATFFLGGRWAAREPSLVRRMVADGMEIASHGDAHRHVGSLDLNDNLREIRRAEAAIVAAGGVRPTLYGPAYGEVSPAVLWAAQRAGYRVVLWSIDTIDWRASHTEEIIRSRVLRRLAPGAIILIHPTDRTARALPALLAAIRGRGYRIVTVSELLAGGGRARQEPASDRD